MATNFSFRSYGVFIKKNILPITGIVIGAIFGFLYWKFIGCNTGSCAITSSRYNSSVYGAVMGGLLFSIFRKSDKHKSQITEFTTD